MDNDVLLGTSALARVLERSEGFVRRLIDGQGLPAVRDSGRRRLVRLADAQEYLAKQRQRDETKALATVGRT